MEDLLWEVESVKRLVGLRRSAARPDETTITNFRHLWVWGDAGYRAGGKPEENRHAEVDGQVAMKAGKLGGWTRRVRRRPQRGAWHPCGPRSSIRPCT